MLSADVSEGHIQLGSLGLLKDRASEVLIRLPQKQQVEDMVVNINNVHRQERKEWVEEFTKRYEHQLQS